MDDEHLLLLGEIKGKLSSIEKKVDHIDVRLQKVEAKAARNGAISGGVASVGVALIVAGIKSSFWPPGGS